MSDSIAIHIARYRPGVDDAPTAQRYDVPMDGDLSVLEVLNYIKDEIDPTLAYRWSCRMAICGSCGVMIDGEPRLGCNTFLREFADRGELHVRALDNFPVERDLIVDLEGFMDHLEAVKPWMMHETERSPAEGEYRQTPEELERFQQFSQCINCGLCYAACPQFGRDDSFLGPAALTLALRYNLDSRDDGNSERMAALNADEGVWRCTFVGYCTEVCPKDVDPAAAVNRGKVASTINYGLNLLRLAGGKHDT